MHARLPSLALWAFALFTADARGAEARPVRFRFEPTDLEMEDPGVLDLDLQLGPIQGPGGSRFVAPDFEVDLGLTDHLELDLDGAYALYQYDPLWLSLKISNGFWGVQVGPKIPIGTQDGIGAEGLVLVGVGYGRWIVVVNLGAFVDPGAVAGAERPMAIQGGLTFDWELGAVKPHAELGAVGFVSPDANQLVLAAGVVWSVRKNVDLSLMALGGIFEGADRYGLLAGISPKFRLFGSR